MLAGILRLSLVQCTIGLESANDQLGGLGPGLDSNHLAPNHQFSPIIVDQNKKSMRFFCGEERYR